MQQIKTYKGIDLLDKIFEFCEMTPDTKLWTINALQGDQPRQIRLKQINALINAFFPENTATNLIERTKKLFSDSKNDTIHTILSGDYLNKQNINDFSELVDLIKSTVRTKENFESEEREIHIGHLYSNVKGLRN